MQKPIQLPLKPDFSFIKKHDKDHGTDYAKKLKMLIEMGIQPVLTGPTELDIQRNEAYLFKITCGDLPNLPDEKEYVSSLTSSNGSPKSVFLGFMRNKTIVKHLANATLIPA